MSSMAEMTREPESPTGHSIIGARLAGKYMTFKLADQAYGLEILKVREIIGLMRITRVPRAKENICGVINLRGMVISVVDLRMRFGLPQVESTEQSVIIVVRYEVDDGEVTIGALVDEVLEVLDIDAGQIEAPPDFGAGAVDDDFILGVGKEGERLIFLLDAARALNAEIAAGVSAPSIDVALQ